MPASQPPAGYDEAGEALATAVLSGCRNKTWALDYAMILGYGEKDLEAWIKWAKRRYRWKLRRARQREAVLAERSKQALEAYLKAEAKAKKRVLDEDAGEGVE